MYSDLARWTIVLTPALLIFTIMFILYLRDKRRLAISTAAPAWRDGSDSELVSIEGCEVSRDNDERDSLLGRYGSSGKDGSPRGSGLSGEEDKLLGKFPKSTFEHME